MAKNKEIGLELQAALIRKFDLVKESRKDNEPEFLTKKRDKAKLIFEEQGFPNTSVELWRKTNIKKFVEKDYELDFEANSVSKTEEKLGFRCDINQFDTDLYTYLNGRWIDGADGITTYENGTIVGSLSSAIIAFPELFEKYFGASIDNTTNGLIALNSALYTDGYFIFVPDGVEHDRSIQVVNIIDSDKNIFSNTRNLVILGENSKLSLVHCDDSVTDNHSFINNVTEISLERGAKLDFYKLQNKDDNAAVMTNTFIKQAQDSNLNTNTVILNGGMVRNDTHVALDGRGANADVMGLYLMDRMQFVDNHVFISHNVPNCTSNQLFKGIVDEEAKSVYNGHTLVQKDAQQTLAFQNNNNIQLTNTSKVDSHPFLEIYADDVKCSHGSTVGQLDTDAMFYLMQRGICERNAKMLLMVAFVGEIVDKIKLPKLRESIDELVRKRLKGELNSCEQCSIQCSNPDSPIEFEIDMSLL
jgi:Fe-S cluster assembly protein SufD